VSVRRRSAVLALPAALSLAAACSRPDGAAGRPVEAAVETVAPANGDAPAPIDASPRIDAVAGAPVVVPVPRSALVTPMRVLLDDGTTLRHRLFLVGVNPRERLGGVRAWLGPGLEWTSAEVAAEEAVADASRRALIAWIDPPLSPRDGTVWIGDTRVTVRWLDAGARGVEPVARTLGVPVTGELRELLGREASSPLTRWRARLILDGLDAGPTTGGFDDPLLESLARQVESRWRVALAGLERADAALARDVRVRLGAVATVADGVAVPAWSPGDASADALLETLLTPGADGRRLAQLARAWLREQPAGAAWVTDDAGVLAGPEGTAARVPWATVAYTNLSPREQLVWWATQGSVPVMERGIEPTPVQALRTLRFAAPVNPDPGAAPGSVGASVVRIGVGEWSVDAAAIAGPLAVRPPGLVMGPFAPDLTLAHWLAGATPNADEAWTTAAMLSRVDGERAWEVFAEMRTDGEAAGEDAIFVYAGPPGKDGFAVRVARDGRGTLVGLNPAVREELGDAASGVTVARLPDRWTARVRLPARVVEGDGLLRIGLARIDPRGVRACWPRAAPPWQPEPGRVVIDTKTWGSTGRAVDPPE